MAGEDCVSHWIVCGTFRIYFVVLSLPQTGLFKAHRKVGVTMIEYISGFISGLKELTPKLSVALFVATGTLTFVPEELLQAIGVLDISIENKTLIGVAFILSVAVLVSNVIFWLGRIFKSKRELSQMKKALQFLTPDEKAYLRMFVEEGNASIHFKIDDGVAGALRGRGFLTRLGIGNDIHGFAHMMEPWARQHLEKNPNYLDGYNLTPEGPPGY